MANLWDTLIGHDSRREMLRHAIAKGRLAHTFLFVGPPGIGKRMLAHAVAQSLLCERHSAADLDACGQCSGCKQVAAGTHPDLFQIGLPAGKQSLPIELFLGPEERRGKEGLCYELSLKPMAGGRKIAIIDDADSLNEASANSLLKTLEEPPPHSLLILVGTTPDAQLPTIRSRCQKLQFAPLTSEQVIEILIRDGIADDRSQAEAVAALCDGSVQTASELLDPQVRSLREAVYNLLAADGRQRYELAGQVVEALEEGSDTSEQRKLAGWAIRFAIEFYRGTIWQLGNDGGAATADSPSSIVLPPPQVTRFTAKFPNRSLDDLDLVGELLERVFQADSHLQRNMSPKLCIEGLFDELTRIERSRRTPATAGSAPR
ncbi:MAG: DNA polymerase III subunit delta' [Planctomycetales bacterium]|nr:DNA polymerase III subunit delta' [Planctomycetales bacterium]